MEILKNLKFMCRVCTVDTKKRRSTSYTYPSYTSGHGIFDTPGLIEKLQKFLNIKIHVNDELPKIVCGLCLKKLDFMEKFAGVARKTEFFLNDFIKISHNAVLPPSTVLQFKNEFNSLAQRASKNDMLQFVEDSPPDVVEDVIVNVSLTEPLTIDMGNKIVQAQQKQKLKRKQVSLLKSQRQAVANPFTSTGNQFHTSTPKNFNEKTNCGGNNLEMKRQNLKMVLSNELSRNDVVIKPVPIAANVIPALVPIVSPTLDINVVPPQIAVRNFAQITPQLPYFNSVNDCLNLGSVIKDMDLLKLILKALKWTYNVNNLQSQIIRLKQTPFRDVMVDPNLLQDTDLMQILSSYLRPMLLQTQQIQNNFVCPLPEKTTILPSNISYKLPAETSVQVINVQPTNANIQPPIHRNHAEIRSAPLPKKRPKLIPQKDHSIIVLSDSEDDIQKFEVSIDPSLFFTGGDSSNSNESLLANLNFQQARLQEQIKLKKPRRRKQTYSKVSKQMASVDIDDPESDILVIDEDRDNYPAPIISKPKRRSNHPKKRYVPIKPKPTIKEKSATLPHVSFNPTKLSLPEPNIELIALPILCEHKSESIKSKTEKKVDKTKEASTSTTTTSTNTTTTTTTTSSTSISTELKDNEDDDIIWGEFMILGAPMPRRIKKEKSKSVDITQKPPDTITPTKTFADADSTTKNRYVALASRSCISKMDIEDHLEVSLIDRKVTKKPEVIVSPIVDERLVNPKKSLISRMSMEETVTIETVTVDTSCESGTNDIEKVKEEIVSTLDEDNSNKIDIDINDDEGVNNAVSEAENQPMEFHIHKKEKSSDDSSSPTSSLRLSKDKTEELTCHNGISSKDIKPAIKIEKITSNSPSDTKKLNKIKTAPVERRNTRSQKATDVVFIPSVRPARKSKTFSKYYKGPSTTNSAKESIVLAQKEPAHITRTTTRASVNSRKRS